MTWYNSPVSIFDKLARIRGVTWTWRDGAAPLGKVPGAADAGVIAQDVQAVFPELVQTSPEGYLKVSYTGLVGVIIEAVKELKAKNDELERRVAELEKARAPSTPVAGAPPGGDAPQG